MIVQSVIPIYHNNPSTDSVRVVEWKTTVDERNHKVYHDSKEYTIHLYTKNGLQERTNKSTIDLLV